MTSPHHPEIPAGWLEHVERLQQVERDVAALRRRIDGSGTAEHPGLAGLIGRNATGIDSLRDDVAALRHQLQRAAWMMAGAAASGAIGGTWLFDLLRSAS